ncbi:WD40 repeat domain-containing serine/threonine protein kinase [Singulisphaera acidiphila]|uniref:WD40 repeat-containing protein n=1 Tax=Singulisphaera acidiphila (strain ATCC BAA-1392 / DSM 18658 / VKM B-2454 / MOB10) TaxID=886293 RepID=L0DR60_SINAD|nr:protein kinase [Singulisphaera acidiphila]AGA31513.1 WD40 repeat-containing protein [Singulisphaera acidiphila DSM 18658]
MGSSLVPGERERQLRDLCAELGRRLRAGEACRVEVYLEQHPELADDEDAVIELLYAEYVVREERGEEPAPEEWYARFPQWRDRLGRLLEFHRILEAEEEEGWLLAEEKSPPRSSATLTLEGPALPPLGAFELIEEIGRGGMGVVYKARQSALNRTVAVKVILAGGLAGPRERERLRFEAEAVAKFHHPNIVQVFEFVERGDLPYIVLEYVEGCNLAEFQRRSERRVDWSARLIETLARAIHHAHQRGIVHRDLTPANVLIAVDETPKISDFGLAKSLAQEGSTSLSGSFLGTPRYMAPEQVTGRSRDVGPPADIYALGAILYELLTGVVPFQGTTPLETLRQVLEDVPEAPSRVRPDVPADLETICLKCLEREPGRRYLSAADLAEDLRRFQAGEPILARPTSTMRRLLKWARRRPAEAALAALVVVAVAGILIAGFWSNAWLVRHGLALEDALARERGQAVAARTARLQAEQNERIARRHWSGSQIKLAQQAWEAGHIELAQELLANERLEPGRGDLPGFEWSYLHRLCHRDFSLLWGHTDSVYSVAVAPDGRSLASYDLGGNVLLWNRLPHRPWTARGLNSLPGSRAAVVPQSPSHTADPGARSEHGEVRLRDVTTGRGWTFLTGNAGIVNLLGFSPDGTALNVWDQTRPDGAEPLAPVDFTLRLDRSAPGRLFPRIFCLAHSSDGRFLATVGRDGRLSLRDATTGRERRSLRDTGSPIHYLAFSRDGERLAASLADAGLAVWETGSGRLLNVFKDHDAPVRQIAIAPDGTTLATIEGERQVVFRDLTTGRKWAVRAEAAGFVHAIAFAPDGRTLAMGGERLRTRLCDVATGAELAVFARESDIIRTLMFTPDGRTVILGGDDPRVRLWHLVPPLDDSSLAGHAVETWSLAFSPDGRTLVSGSDDHTIVVWDVAGRRKRLTLRGHESTVSDLAFFPDGRTLAAADFSRHVKLWDVEQGRELATLVGHVDRVRSVAISPDGKTVASAGSDLSLRLWDVASRTCRAILEGHDDTVRALAYSPDGRILASAGNDRKVILRDSLSGLPRLSWNAPSAVTSLAFSPDGTRLALGGEDRSVTIWEVADGRLLVTLRGHVHRVLTVAFSPDGESIVSAGEDRTVRLWDPVTGQERLTLKGHQAKVNAVAFSPDGRLLASGSHDGAMRLWHGPKEDSP